MAKTHEALLKAEKEYQMNYLEPIREEEKARMMDRLKDLTHLENPNSRDQILAWLAEQGLPLENLQAETVEHTINMLEASDTLRFLLYHPESDSLWLEIDPEKAELDLSSGLVENVTGIEQFEKRLQDELYNDDIPF